tara:strand:- start:1152 stop:1304 length:153 start_codon:yes stop_codon:yes gene_type:complete
MIPNCLGCEIEFDMACQLLEEGYNVAFGGMGERRHLLIWGFDERGKVILE